MKKSRFSLIKLLSLISGILVIAVILFIFLYIFLKGYKSINLKFIFDKPKGDVFGKEGGIFPAIIGSLYLLLISTAFAGIFGIACAIYTSFYCKSRKTALFINLITECISGIPSIVLGLFGYTFFVLNLNFGKSLLSGGLTLGIMIFPFVEIRVEKALKEIKRDVINSSYSLGVGKAYTILKLVLPIIKKEILSTLALSGGFAMGAAAPIILTCAVLSSLVPKSIFDPSMALPYHLYILVNEGISMEKAYGTAFVLMLILIIINAGAYTLALRGGKNE